MTDERIIKALQTVLNKIHHPENGVFQELNSIKDKPYEVVNIITTEQLEQIKTMDDIIQKSRRQES